MRRLTLLAAALMALWAGGAWAQGQARMGDTQWKKTHSLGVVGGVTSSDTTVYPFNVDASGNQQMSDVNRDRDYWVLHNLAYQDSIGVTKSIDSTGVLDVHALKHVVLFIKPNFVKGSPVLVAISVRGHSASSADSASTVDWIDPTRQIYNVSPDSAGVWTAGINSTNAGAGTAETGEYVVQFLDSGSSLSPRGFAIPLPDFWFPYMSIRVRLLQAWTGGKQVHMTIKVLGSAL